MSGGRVLALKPVCAPGLGTNLTAPISTYWLGRPLALDAGSAGGTRPTGLVGGEGDPDPGASNGSTPTRQGRSTDFTWPLKSSETSFADAGMAVVVSFPPGQRTQRCVGGSGAAITWTALSWDQ